jgi:hypothetical protein
MALKLVIECKADISPVVLEEKQTVDKEQGVQHVTWKLHDPPKRCRKFEPLQNWYRDNTICSSWCGAPEIYMGKLESHGH